MIEQKSRVCPYLGLVMDRETTHISTSKVHRCFRYEPATRVKLDYQAAYCMASRHLECAVFLGKRVVQDPRRRDRQPGTLRRKGLGKSLGLTLGLLGAAGLVIWLGIWFGWLPIKWIGGTNVKATSLVEPDTHKDRNTGTDRDRACDPGAAYIHARDRPGDADADPGSPHPNSHPAGPHDHPRAAGRACA